MYIFIWKAQLQLITMNGKLALLQTFTNNDEMHFLRFDDDGSITFEQFKQVTNKSSFFSGTTDLLHSGQYSGLGSTELIVVSNKICSSTTVIAP